MISMIVGRTSPGMELKVGETLLQLLFRSMTKVASSQRKSRPRRLLQVEPEEWLESD